MKNLLKKIEISPLLVLILIISILFRVEKQIYFLYLFCIIHEIFHLFGALIFKCQIIKFSISYFGCNLMLNDVEYLTPLKQIIIYILGPISYFISYVIMIIFFNINIITSYEFELYNTINISIALINLIPLYPLDGGRIFEVLFKIFFDIEKVFKIKKIISFISLLFLNLILIHKAQYILLIFINLISLISLFSNMEIINYLEKRLFYKNEFAVSYNNKCELYHFKNNYYLKKLKLLNEEEIITSKLIKVKRINK